MQRTVYNTIARERATAQLLLFFAASALVLVAVGVYGLYAGEVTRRRREIGIRLALGATSGSVVGSLLARAVSRAALGVVAGAVVGYELSRAREGALQRARDGPGLVRHRRRADTCPNPPPPENPILE